MAPKDTHKNLKKTFKKFILVVPEGWVKIGQEKSYSDRNGVFYICVPICKEKISEESRLSPI